ncbi:unnamed protein product [Prorocentrum cordatum]|uniref:peptidylprolyl isomerase n=1 Tax=Prorocentrum cordatum TaxID=2364126 RepID=A0ABN9PD75_9DINO|nr:unnamed protein product [Polarella glacialis]
MAAAAAPAPPEPLDLLGDGRLTKRVLREGSGVEVHYVCRAAGGSEVPDSSRERGAPLAFALGGGEAIPGLEHAVPTMSGRCALAVRRRRALVCQPSAACRLPTFGGAEVALRLPEPGPADASGAAEGAAAGCLDLEVELVGAAAPARWEGGQAELAELSQEERLARAARRKEAGNAGFGAGSCAAAARDYGAALALLGFAGSPEDREAWSDAARQEARAALALACFLNLAQCELRLERFAEAAEHASEALGLDPGSAKAVYRRGLARLGAGHAELARGDLLESARREPRNAEIRAKLQECQGQLRATEMSARSTFGGMFGRASIYAEGAGTAPSQQRASGAAGGAADS